MAVAAAVIIGEHLTLAAYLGIGSGMLFEADFGRTVAWVPLHDPIHAFYDGRWSGCVTCGKPDDHWLHGPWILETLIGVQGVVQP